MARQVQALAHKWSLLQAAVGLQGALPQLPMDQAPLRGMKARDFMSIAGQVALELVEADKDDKANVELHWYKHAAIALVQWGFRSVNQIDGLEAEDFQQWKLLPKPKAILISVARTLTRTTRSLVIELPFAEKAAVRAAVRQESEVCASALNLADEIQPRNFQKEWTILEDRGIKVGISKFGEDAKPRTRRLPFGWPQSGPCLGDVGERS